MISREFIIQRMEALGISQRELSRRSGMHPSPLNQYLRGTRDLDTPNLMKLVEALGGGKWVWGKFKK